MQGCWKNSNVVRVCLSFDKLIPISEAVNMKDVVMLSFKKAQLQWKKEGKINMHFEKSKKVCNEWLKILLEKGKVSSFLSNILMTTQLVDIDYPTWVYDVLSCWNN